jgi:hypothetical protein
MLGLPLVGVTGALDSPMEAVLGTLGSPPDGVPGHFKNFKFLKNKNQPF